MSNYPGDNGLSLSKTYAFLNDLMSRRNTKRKGHNNIRIVERQGGRIVEPTAFEPDANTHRGTYYYNAKSNTLYRKMVIHKENGIRIAYWQKISE